MYSNETNNHISHIHYERERERERERETEFIVFVCLVMLDINKKKFPRSKVISTYRKHAKPKISFFSPHIDY